MNIAIVGSGAVGSLLGAFLVRKGHSVTLVCRPDHASAIQKNGLTIKANLNSLCVALPVVHSLAFKADIIFLAVKYTDLSATCASIHPYAAGCIVVTLQNGVMCDDLCQAMLPQSTLVGGIVLFNAQYFSAGVITYGAQGSILVGDPHGLSPQAVDTVATLLGSIMPCTKVSTIKNFRYAKLLVNSINNSLDALTSMPLNQCMDHPELRIIGLRILRETVSVLRHAKIPLRNTAGFKIRDLVLIAALPLWIGSLILWLRMHKRRQRDIFSSTIQSLIRHKATEIDFLHGEIVRLAASLQLKAPYNQKVVSLIHTIEQTHIFYSPEELVHHFSRL